MFTDEMLRRALAEVDEAMLASLPDPAQCDHQFSPRFERKMRAVRRRANHPTAYKFLQRAACILLAMLLLFGSLVAFNPKVRAAVLNWLRDWLGDFYSYSYYGETNTEEQADYELARLPDGYIFTDSYPTDGGNCIVYTNESNRILQFSYVHGAAINPLVSDGVGCNLRTAYRSTVTADIYISQEPHINSSIVWADADKGVLFYISGDCCQEELVWLAEGVVEIANDVPLS